MRANGRWKALSMVVATAALAGPVLVATAPSASAAPAVQVPGLAAVTIASGLNQPTVVRFAPDGRFFVAEKQGTIKAYSAIGDSTPDAVINLQTEVNNYWDRGLLGLEVDSQFPTRPYIYALYVRDAIPGEAAAGHWNDTCLTPPGGTTDGCPVGARLVRITVDPMNNTAVGAPLTLVDSTVGHGWCFQFPSHAIGTVKMGPDGQLYVGAGDGASFGGVDYGQLGGTLPSPGAPLTPADPCGPKPGTAQQLPSAAGGAFRAQSPPTPSRPTYDGAIVKVDPDTGAASVVAFGLRNPFRFNFRAGTSELWVGDVGYNTWEEIDNFTPGAGPAPNFGWPCYEGSLPLADYQNLGTDLCTNLNNLPPGSVKLPFYSYRHGANPDQVNCAPPSVGGNAVIGGTFYSGSEWPPQYDGAYIFGDNSRRCIWAMIAPSPTNPPNIATLVSDTGVVDLETGPAGDLVWTDLGKTATDGAVYRLRSTAANLAPVPAFTATPQYGSRDVVFDASATTDPNIADVLTYSWTFGDGPSTASGRTATHHYNANGVFTVALTVTDQLGAAATSTVKVGPGIQPPQVGITAIDSALGQAPDGVWRVGDTIAFSANVTGGTAPFSYQWHTLMHHCETANPTACHTHPDVTGPLPATASGSFSAPDHSYPSYLELQLTVTDALGIPVSASLAMHPATSTLSASSYPLGLTIGVATGTVTTPASVVLITGTTATLSAPSEQWIGGRTYQFAGWSDGVAAETRSIVLPAGTTAVTANYLSVVTRINAGGGDLADPLSAWAADTGTGGVAVSTSATITNRPVGTPAALFQSQRQGPSSWTIPLAAGQYEVRTFFCELDGTKAPGDRTVTVNAEGSPIVSALDVRAAAGATDVGIRRTATVTVTDGVLNIDVVAGAGTPMISGIEVLGHAKGYWMTDLQGRVYAFGTPYLGAATETNVVDIQPSPTGNGYWTLNDRGRVHPFGDARFYGDQPALGAGERVTAMTATRTGNGYWLFTNIGRAINYGDAVHYGDLVTLHLVPNGPVLRAITTATGAGYYMVGSDGGIFAFGDAVFYGSMGDQRLNAPVQSLVPDPDGVGYWLVASDGGVFAFQAGFRGSMGDKRLNAPVTGMVAFGNGYLMVARDGGIFDFSDEPFLGSLGGQAIPAPVVAVAGYTGV